MGDFFQNGVITTFHNLNHRSIEEFKEIVIGLDTARKDRV